jgi:hypothetical protein
MPIPPFNLILVADGLQDLRNVEGVQHFRQQHLPGLHVHANLGNLYAETGHRFIVLALARLLADTRVAHYLARDASGRQGGEVQGATARSVRADTASASLYPGHRDAQGLGHLPLPCLSELQDAQVHSRHGSAWQALKQSLRQRSYPSLPAASRVGWGLAR